MKAVMNEKNDDIILFIDEIHTIVGAGGATGSLMLEYVNHIARGDSMYWCNNIENGYDNIEKDIRKTFSKDNCEPTSVEKQLPF
jgi:ATP-dependent Clp protease ATP-binding subunit ClpC